MNEVKIIYIYIYYKSMNKSMNKSMITCIASAKKDIAGEYNFAINESNTMFNKKKIKKHCYITFTTPQETACNP